MRPADAGPDSSRDEVTVDANGIDSSIDAAACEPPDPALAQRIHVALDGEMEELEGWLDPDYVAGDPNGIYDTQLVTANLLLYAEIARDAVLLERLAELYDRGFDSLVERSRVHYYWAVGPDGEARRDQVFDLDPPARMWTYPAQEGLEVGAEAVLCASQFLYAVARVVRIVSEMRQVSDTLRAFVERATPVLAIDHYRRWTRRNADAPGSFQTAGWGCTEYGRTYDHREHVENLLARRYGTAELGRLSDLSYCNAVTDTDLFIGAGVAELLAANANDSQLVPLDADTAALLRDYVVRVAALAEQRHVAGEVLHDGAVAQVAVFDRGSWDDHPDHAYSGVTETGPDCWACLSRCEDVCPEFPGYKGRPDGDPGTPRLPPAPAVGTGWDLSHGRRFVVVLDSFHRHSTVLGTSFPSLDDIAAYARQLAFVVWNQSTTEPRFATSFDGNDGWYRVNYSARSAFGYAPGVMTQTVGGYGYGFWSALEPELGEALSAVRATFPPATPRDEMLFLPEETSLSLYGDHCLQW